MSISNVIHLPVFMSINHLFHPPSPFSMRVLPHSTTHPFIIPCPHIPIYYWILPWQNQGPLLPFVTNKTLLCFILHQSQESPHVYSLDGSLFAGLLVGRHCFSYGVAKPLSSCNLISDYSSVYHILSLMVDCGHSPPQSCHTLAEHL